MWGPAQVCNEIRRKICVELGAAVRRPETVVRVYGYGPSFGLNDNSYAQQEMRGGCGAPAM